MDNPLFNLHTSDSDKIEITRATNPESRVRSACHFFYYKPRNHGPESGEGRQQSPGGCPKTQSPKRMALGRCTWFQIQDPRSGVTEVSRPGAPKVQDPDSGRRPVALPQSDAQKPESRVRRAPQGPRREGPTRRIQSPASGGAPEAAEGRQGPRIQGQALRGGDGEGQDPEGQGGGARTPGFISTNENP